MATIFKVLGQLNPSGNTATSLYTVPGATSTIVSSINVCNQGAANATFRLAIRPSGESLVAKHYVAYDVVIPTADVITMSLGMTLSSTDVVTVYANSATVSFSAFGSELS